MVTNSTSSMQPLCDDNEGNAGVVPMRKNLGLCGNPKQASPQTSTSE